MLDFSAWLTLGSDKIKIKGGYTASFADIQTIMHTAIMPIYITTLLFHFKTPTSERCLYHVIITHKKGGILRPAIWAAVCGVLTIVYGFCLLLYRHCLFYDGHSSEFSRSHSGGGTKSFFNSLLQPYTSLNTTFCRALRSLFELVC